MTPLQNLQAILTTYNMRTLTPLILLDQIYEVPGINARELAAILDLGRDRDASGLHRSLIRLASVNLITIEDNEGETIYNTTPSGDNLVKEINSIFYP